MGARFAEARGDDPDLAGVLRAAVAALSGPERSLGADEVEAALLDRAGTRRCFRRLSRDEVATALA